MIGTRVIVETNVGAKQTGEVGVGRRGGVIEDQRREKQKNWEQSTRRDCKVARSRTYTCEKVVRLTCATLPKYSPLKYGTK